jgi:hypothetical protein
MFKRKQFRGSAFFALTFFICFTLAYEYSYAQEENQLLKAQGLYKQGNFIEAVKVLNGYVISIEGVVAQKKNYAEANCQDMPRWDI